MDIHEIFENKATEVRKHTIGDTDKTEWESFKEFIQGICWENTIRESLIRAIFEDESSFDTHQIVEDIFHCVDDETRLVQLKYSDGRNLVTVDFDKGFEDD